MAEYLEEGRLALGGYRVQGDGAGDVDQVDASVFLGRVEQQIGGSGNGPIAAFVNALADDLGVAVSVRDYHEHALGGGRERTGRRLRRGATPTTRSAGASASIRAS